jgi:chaperone LolA
MIRDFRKYILAICLGLGLALPARADALKTIKKVVQKYQSAQGTKSIIQRTIKITMLDQTKSSSGELSLSKGRLRMEINSPDETTVVYDKKLVWVVTPTPKELGGKLQVLKIKTSDIDKQNQAPIALLLGDQNAWNLFKVKSQKKTGDLLNVVLTKKKKSDVGVQGIELEVNVKDSTIQSLAYSDELENQTKFDFSKTDFSAKLPNSLFTYTPPTGAEVTEFK